MIVRLVLNTLQHEPYRAFGVLLSDFTKSHFKKSDLQVLNLFVPIQLEEYRTVMLGLVFL